MARLLSADWSKCKGLFAYQHSVTGADFAPRASPTGADRGPLAIEQEIRGQPPDERRRRRQAQSLPIAEGLI